LGLIPVARPKQNKSSGNSANEILKKGRGIFLGRHGIEQYAEMVRKAK